MIGERQKEILNFAKENDGITTAEANKLIAHTYYHNGKKYTSEVLSRLVARGFLKRETRGKYRIGNLKGEKQQLQDPDQIKLF